MGNVEKGSSQELMLPCPPHMLRCTIRECGEEGAVAMDSAQLTLQQCTISGCKGPGVDCSGTARLALCGGSVEGNVGGVWLWEGSSAEVTRASISGGPSHAILADGNSQPLVRVSGACCGLLACVCWKGSQRGPWRALSTTTTKP